MLYFLCCILLFIIIIFAYFLVHQKNKYLKQISDIKNEINISKDKCSFYLTENIKLKKSIYNYESEKFSKDNFLEIYGLKIKYNPIYKGKKALIGDYIPTSYNVTKTVLQSLGFSVDIVHNCQDVVKKIQYGEQYDIIFSNNIYKDGTGSECLSELKKIPNFSIPVVIHTIEKNSENYFTDEIGFNAYIEKPLTQEKVIAILKGIF